MSLLILGTAIWLGILTSISPCPLASNIAAISFISRDVRRTGKIFLSGLLYTTGRALAYVVIAFIILKGLTAADEISRFLQKYMNLILGPILMLVGLLLLEMITVKGSFNLAGAPLQKRVEQGGILWALLLGMLFALSFCPISAGLFFGGLIPLSLKANSAIAAPVLFGVGTAVPVLLFAGLIAFASQSVGKYFDRLTLVERWMRRMVGILFILVGFYYCLTHIYGVKF